MKNPNSSVPAESRPGSSILVSVIIPAYQAAGYIAQTLDSVFAQAWGDFEVLLVNDGSPDSNQLEHALQPYMARLRYIRQENRGPSSARNTAIRQARGTYVAFLDSDDLWLPHHLSSQVQALQADPELKLVYADSFLLEDGVPIGRAFEVSAAQFGDVSFEALIRETCTVNTSSTVASRLALLEAGGFDESMMRCEDLDLWLRMAHGGARMRYSRDVQACHRIRNGLSSNRELMKQARIAVYKKALATLELSPGQRCLMEECIRKVQAELELEGAKRLLASGEYDQALAATRRANVTLHSWKLTMAATGLRCAPALFRRSFNAYQRLRQSQKQKQSRGFRPAAPAREQQLLASVVGRPETRTGSTKKQADLHRSTATEQG